MKKKVLKLALCVGLMAVLVCLDQLSKMWAVETLRPMLPKSIDIIKGVFELHYLENTGMAFGLFANQQIFFYIVTGIFVIIGGYILYKTPENKRFLPMNIIVTVILAGAFGNLIDRAMNQYVVDFLYFSLIDFPIFNVADCYVTIGVILVAVWMVFVYKDAELKMVYGFKKAKNTNESGNGTN